MFDATMNFGLGEEIEALQETVRRFAAERIAPLADEIDRANEFPMHLWREMGDLGLLGVTVSEELGGAGMAILPTPSRWRRSAAPRPRWASATARTPTSASTRSS